MFISVLTPAGLVQCLHLKPAVFKCSLHLWENDWEYKANSTEITLGNTVAVPRWNAVGTPDLPDTHSLRGSQWMVEQSGDTRARLCQNPCREGNSVSFPADNPHSSLKPGEIKEMSCSWMSSCGENHWHMFPYQGYLWCYPEISALRIQLPPTE